MHLNNCQLESHIHTLPHSLNTMGSSIHDFRTPTNHLSVEVIATSQIIIIYFFACPC